jgi:hypothetical protein
MHKLVFYADGDLELGQAKTWLPSREQEEIQAGMAELRQVKLFGSAPRTDPATVSKGFVAQPDGAGPVAKRSTPGRPQVEINGVLVAACLAEEVAMADTTKTNGLSVFTFYLLDAIGHLGPRNSPTALCAEAERRMDRQGYWQTPVVKPPSNLTGLEARPFILMPTTSTCPGRSPVDRLWQAVRDAVATSTTAAEGV